jgi:transcriptional regulator with XRE-family HTH domain
MSGDDLRRAREELGLTQLAAAGLWRVSQPYLSLMERGRRPVPERLVRLAVRANRRLVTGLVLDPARLPKVDLERQLGNLGYPGFAYLGKVQSAENPASVVLGALRQPVMSARVAEALPWVMLTYPQLNWDWLVDHVRLVNRQNRLGFLVSLAKQLAGRSGNEVVGKTLERVEGRLEEARLAREDTLGRSLTEVERNHLRVSRPPAAAHWNVLTNLQVEHLRYVS